MQQGVLNFKCLYEIQLLLLHLIYSRLILNYYTIIELRLLICLFLLCFVDALMGGTYSREGQRASTSHHHMVIKYISHGILQCTLSKLKYIY